MNLQEILIAAAFALAVGMIVGMYTETVLILDEGIQSAMELRNER